MGGGGEGGGNDQGGKIGGIGIVKPKKKREGGEDVF